MHLASSKIAGSTLVQSIIPKVWCVGLSHGNHRVFSLNSLVSVLNFPCRNGPYELQAAGEKETPLQKLNRLKCEVAELEKDILENKAYY